MKFYLLFFYVLFFAIEGFTQGSGNCLSFDGANDYIESDDILTNAQLQGFTVTAWIKPSNSGTYGTIFAINENDPAIDNNVNLLYYHGPSRQLRYFDKLPNHNNVSTQGVYPPGHWYHVTMTLDNSRVRIYVNGVEVFEDAFFARPTNGDRISFGQDWDGFSTSSHFLGEMDEMTVWSRELSEVEIRDNMCRTFPISTAGLLAQFKLDDQNGNVVQDYSGNGNDGTLINTAPSARVVSGAPIGDESFYLYPSNWANQAVSADLDSSRVEVFNVQGNPSGLHVFKVRDVPNSVQGVNFVDCLTDYFGVFPTNLTAQYDLRIDVSGVYSNCDNDCGGGLEVVERNDNSVNQWEQQIGIFYSSNCSGTLQNESSSGAELFRGEYIVKFNQGADLGGILPPLADTAFCANSSVVFSIDTDVYTDVTFLGQTGPSIIIDSAGTFIYSFDFEGCTFSDTITTTEIMVDLTDQQDTVVLCDQQSLNVSLADVPHDPGTIVWNGSIFSDNYTFDQEENVNVAWVYEGCDFSFEYYSVLDNTLDFQVSGDTIVCEGQGTLYEIMPFDPNYSYFLNGDPVDDSQVMLFGGQNLISAESTFGCSSDTSFSISVIPQPSMIPDSFSVCAGDSILLTLDSINYPSSQWNDVSGATILASSPSVYGYSFEALGCLFVDSVVVSDVMTPFADLEPVYSLCFADDSVRIDLGDVQDVSDLEWSNGSTGTIFSTSFGGDYSLSFNYESCPFEQAFSVVQDSLRVFDILGDSLICEREDLLLSLNPFDERFNYFLNGAGVNPDQIIINEPGFYVFTVESASGGCRYSDSLTIRQDFIPNIVLPQDTSVCSLFMPFRIEATASPEGIEVEWSTGESGLEISVQDAGSYEAFAQNGCGLSRDAVRIERPSCTDIYIPNAFSPNGDGNNDVFTFYSNDVEKVNSFKIFHRWGGIAWEGTNLDPWRNQNGWDGRSKGELMDPSVFVYLIDVEFIDGSREVFSGDLTLIK